MPALRDVPVELEVAATAADGLALIEAAEPDVVLLDVMLPDMSGIEACRRIHDIAPKVPVIFITAGGSSDTAIEAMSLGAFDYLLKPLDLDRVQQLVTQALEIRRLMHVPVQFQADGDRPTPGDLLIGRTPQMQEVYKAIGRVAPQDVATLIRGESGSGKELVARAIYHHSRRAAGPFLAVNCAALAESLLESELFGHEKGSFTGATMQRIGKFEQCNGGTLFLDEVGDMSPLVQSKVLRVLQEQRFERVGGTQTIQTDVRIIAATNRDLEKMVSRGEFREDLFYRLNGFTIQLPPSARAARGHPDSARLVRRPLPPRAGQGRRQHRARRLGNAAQLPLAGQRPATAERGSPSPGPFDRAGADRGFLAARDHGSAALGAGTQRPPAPRRRGQSARLRQPAVALRLGPIARRNDRDGRALSCSPPCSTTPKAISRKRPKSWASPAAACGTKSASWASRSTVRSTRPNPSCRAADNRPAEPLCRSAGPRPADRLPTQPNVDEPVKPATCGTLARASSTVTKWRSALQSTSFQATQLSSDKWVRYHFLPSPDSIGDDASSRA